MERKLVLVQTTVFSGATLLASLMGAHPQIATLGEMNGVLNMNRDTYLCSCGKKIKDCEFWHSVGVAMYEKGFEFDVGDFETRFLQSGPRPIQYLRAARFPIKALNTIRDAIFDTWPAEGRSVKKLATRNDALIESVLDLTGSTVFVDTSKDGLRYLAMPRFSKFDVRAIHLVRDVRGVVASRLRRGHFGGDVGRIARQWVRWNQWVQRGLEPMPDGSYVRVRYEDLCQDPPGTLEKLYRFCEVDPQAGPGDLQVVSNHIVGNSMRLRDLSEIELDERWKGQLTEEHLKKINVVAGKLSNRYGYQLNGYI